MTLGTIMVRVQSVLGRGPYDQHENYEQNEQSTDAVVHPLPLLILKKMKNIHELLNVAEVYLVLY